MVIAFFAGHKQELCTFKHDYFVKEELSFIYIEDTSL